MARLIFAGQSADFAVAAPSAHGGFLYAAPNVTGGSAWTAAAGGAQVTDLAKINPSDPTPIASDADGALIPFYGPDEASPATLGLWVDLGTGRRSYVPARLSTAMLGAVSDSTIAAAVGGTGPTHTALDGKYVGKGAFVVNVRDYGAVGDGTTDDTAAINAAITANPGWTILLPKGTYLINATANAGVSGQPCGVSLNQPGTRLLLDPSTVIKVATNAATNYTAVQVSAADCTVEGGTVFGDVDTHTGTTGEWGHGVEVTTGGHRARLVAVKATKCWGDGFIIRGAVSDVRLVDVLADDNRRQGLSIVDAIRPTVLGGHFINTGLTKFTGPGAGIDLEPNPNTTTQVVDAVIIGVTFVANVGPGFLASANGRPLSALVVGCVATSNGTGVTKAPGFYILGATNATRLAACAATSNGQDGYMFDATTDGVQAAGCTAINNGRHGFILYGKRGKLLDPVAVGNQQSGMYIDPGTDGTLVTGGETVGNSQLTNGTYQNVDIYGINTRIIGHVADAGVSANKPNYGYVIRTGATGARLLGCDVIGAHVGGAITDQTGAAVLFPKPGAARAAAIVTPNAQTAAYVQADVASLKTAVDAIRTALTANGVTF